MLAGDSRYACIWIDVNMKWALCATLLLGTSHSLQPASTRVSTRHSTNRLHKLTFSAAQRHLLDDLNNDGIPHGSSSPGRRRALVASTWASLFVVANPPAIASANGKLFQRQTDQFAYQFQPPAGFEPSNKPLKTHLDEVNFISSTNPKYQFGITVDPVLINSLAEFGTPEQVAAKVVLSEVRRDGVLDVTLMEDPIIVVNDDGGVGSSNTTTTTTAYQLNYLSVGKRGSKRFVARFCIAHQKLYALTAQCLESDYKSLQPELLQAVQSFRVVR